MKGKRRLVVLGALIVIGALVLALTVRGSKGSLKQADRYFESGDFVRALIEYQAVLQKEPKTVRAYKNIATIWLARGNPLGAMRYLNASLQLSPDDLEAKRQRADALYQLLQFGALRQEALGILKLEPTDNEALIHLARSTLTADQIDETSKHLSQLDPSTSATFHYVMGILHVRKGEFDESQASVQKAVALDPKLIPAHELLSSLHFRQNEEEKGEEELKLAAKLSPLRSAARLKYANYLAKSERLDEAATKAEEITSGAPDYLPALTFRAGLLFRQGQQEESHALLEEAFRLDPRNFDAQGAKAQFLVAQGENEKAIETLEAINATYPGLPRTQFNIALLQLKMGKTASAQKSLEDALKTFPDYTEAELLLIELNLRTGRDESETLTRLESLVKSKPNLGQAQLLLSGAYQTAGRYDDAAQLFREQLKTNPDQSGPHYMLGMISLRQEETDEARASFENAQKIAPEDLRITTRLIDMDLVDSDFAAAHRRVQAHLEIEKNRWGAHFLEGRIYMAEKNWIEAEKNLHRSLEFNPKSIATYNSLIDCYLATRKPSEAIKTVRDVLKDNPKSLSHHILLARLLEEEKSYEEAADAYQQALVLSPDFVPALNNLAYLYTESLPNLDKALELARKARDLQPDPAAVSDTLGWIYFKRGEYGQARPLLEEAARNSLDPEISYHVGMARSKDGAEELAAEALRNAVESEKEFNGKEDARKKLAALEGGDSQRQLEARVRADPNAVIARNKLGLLYAEAKNFDKARASYEEALRINSESWAALVGLARLYLGPLADLEKAATLARKAQSIRRNHPRTAGVLGRVNLREHNYKLAAGFLEEAIRTLKDDAVLQKDFGIAAYHLGRVREATAALQRVPTLAPASPEAKEAADFLVLISPPGDGKWIALSPRAEKALKGDPDHVPALMVRAAVRKAAGDQQAALKIYQALGTRLPDFTPAQKELVALLARDPATLEQAYSLGLKVHAAPRNDPDQQFSRLLGEISYRADKADVAIQILEGLTAPLDSEGLFYLGMSYLKTKARAKGESTLQRALAGDLDAELATEAQAALAGKDATED